jgi:hypothetical protein
MNRALVRILLPILIVATVLAFTLALSPLTTGSAAERQQLPPHAQAPTPTPDGQAASQPGSTDGLVIMGFAIALIVVLPILVQRSLWKK